MFTRNRWTRNDIKSFDIAPKTENLTHGSFKTVREVFSFHTVF